MLQEIEAAVNFLTRLVAKSVDPGGPPSKGSTKSSSDQHNSNSNNASASSGKCLTEDKVQEFSRRLTAILQTRFRNHWYPERPNRGQAYRCIRINENCSVDASIAKACQECGISYEALRLPVELTLWIDPNEVTCRFGEHKGSYCVVAKLSDGRQENYVNSINIEELEQQSLEHQKTFDITHSRKKRQQAMLHQRTKNSPMGTMFGNASTNGGTSYHGHHSGMNGSLTNGASPGAHLNSAGGHGSHVPVTSATQSMNGYVDYGAPNGLGGMPPTSSPAAASMQFHSHFGNQQPHFYANSSPFQQHHVVAPPHSSHFGSPTSHLFQKYNHLGLQSQQGPSQPGLAGSRALNAASLAASGTFRSGLVGTNSSSSNSVGSKQAAVNMFQSASGASNSHHSAAAASSAAALAASLGASSNHHSSQQNGGAVSKSSNSSATATSSSGINGSNSSSFARGLQTAFNLAAVPFTPAATVSVNGNGVGSSGSITVASSPSANGYPWPTKSIVKA